MSEFTEVVIDELVPSPLTADPDKVTAPPPADDLEIVIEGQEPPPAGADDKPPDELALLQTQVTDFRKKLEEAEKRELELAQQLQNIRRQTAPLDVVKPPDAPEGEKLSRTQLLAIVKEHKDDPEVLLNVIDYISEQKALGIRDKTVEDIDQRTWHTNLSSIENRAISEDPVLSKRPDIVEKLPAMAAALRIDKHPFGRYLAYLAYRAGNDTGGAAEAAAAAEATRVEDLKKKKGLDPTKVPTKKTVTLTKEQADMAQRFGVSPQTYARFIPKSTEGAT